MKDVYAIHNNELWGARGMRLGAICDVPPGTRLLNLSGRLWLFHPKYPLKEILDGHIIQAPDVPGDIESTIAVLARCPAGTDVAFFGDLAIFLHPNDPPYALNLLTGKHGELSPEELSGPAVHTSDAPLKLR